MTHQSQVTVSRVN